MPGYLYVHKMYPTLLHRKRYFIHSFPYGLSAARSNSLVVDGLHFNDNNAWSGSEPQVTWSTMEPSNIRHWDHILRTLVIVQLWARLSRFSLVLWSRLTISPDTSWSTKSGYSNDDQWSLTDQMWSLSCWLITEGSNNCRSCLPQVSFVKGLEDQTGHRVLW